MSDKECCSLWFLSLVTIYPLLKFWDAHCIPVLRVTGRQDHEVTNCCCFLISLDLFYFFFLTKSFMSPTATTLFCLDTSEDAKFRLWARKVILRVGNLTLSQEKKELLGQSFRVLLTIKFLPLLNYSSLSINQPSLLNYLGLCYRKHIQCIIMFWQDGRVIGIGKHHNMGSI